MNENKNDGFFGRKSGESVGVSRYVQANVPTPDGGTKVVSSMADTPDGKIIIPQLKEGVSEVKELPKAKESGVKAAIKSFTDTANAIAESSQVQAVKELGEQGVKAVQEQKKTLLAQAKAVVDAGFNAVGDAAAWARKALSFDCSKAKNKPTVQTPTSQPVAPAAKGTTNKITEAKPTGEKGEYGKVIVNETKGGHVQLIDNTPGNKRVLNLHPSGTYDSKTDNGDSTDKVVGSKFTFVDKDWKITVFGDEIEVVYGDEHVNIKKNQFVNINGDMNHNVDGERSDHVGNNMMQAVDGNLTEITGADRTESVGGNYDGKIGGKETVKVAADSSKTVGGNMTIIVGGNVQIISGGSVNVTAAKNMQLVAPLVRIIGRIMMN